jgi:general L-amino acid transport system substrate-binding protein
MNKKVFLRALLVAGLASGVAAAATLDDIKSRGVLKCGSNEGLAGFAAPDADGVWQGFDVSFCRAIAAAVLSDAQAVEFIPLTSQARFTALSEGKVDVLIRNSTWTFSRDTHLKLDFVGANYYDGQGFMVRKDLGVFSAKELDNATICIEPGTTTELNLADFFLVNKIGYVPVPVASNDEGQERYLAGACQVYTTDISGLAATRAAFENETDHMILPEVVSKEPLGPVVRDNDSEWADIVGWTLNALIAAEQYGVTSANVLELAASRTANPEINRLLGTEGELGAMIRLDKDWAVRAIAAVGNYGEVFDLNIGEATPIGLARGLNAQWTEGGLLYSPPFR